MNDGQRYETEAASEAIPGGPVFTGWKAHALSLGTVLSYVGFRILAFDALGADGVVGTAILIVAVLGRFVTPAASWTALVACVIPILVTRYLDTRYGTDPFPIGSTAARLTPYFLVGGFIIWQQMQWRRLVAQMRQREQAASTANARWQMASEFAQLGTFDWDLEKQTTNWSPVMERLHGFAEGEHDGKPGTGFKRIHPDDVPVVERAVEQASQTGKTMSLVYRVRLPDGRERWIEGIGRVSLENGKPKRLAGVCSDVTQRHEAYMAAKRYETLTEHAPVGIYLADARGKNLYVNPAWERMTGRKHAEIDGDSWHRMIHPDDLDSARQTWTAAIQNPRVFEYDFRYVRPDGTVVWASSLNAPLFDDQGRFDGYVGCVTDVTERKQAVEALLTSEARFRAIVENAEPAVFLKDEAGKYQVVNATFERLIDKPAAEVIGRDDFELFPPPVAEAFRKTDRRVWESGKAEHVEETIDLADGARTYLSVKYPITDGRGHVVALGGFATDITPLKQIQDDLVRDRRLLRDLIDVQEQERQYICNELHDGTIQYLVGALMTLQSPAVTRDRDPAALGKIDGLLTRAMSEARRLIGGVRSSLLDDLGAAAAIDDLRAQNREMGLDVDFERDDDDNFHDLDERTAVTIFRVAQEALSNVRKHGDVERAVIELRRRGDEIALTVRDEGRGFAPDGVRQECFGLRGMRERVLLAGGTFQLTSAPGRGTTVRAVLPLAPPTPATEGL